MENKNTVSRRRLLKGIAAGTCVTVVAPRVGLGQSQKPKIGVILPASGVLAFPGKQVRRGSEFAAKTIKEGGGPEFELLFADTESKAENGRVAAEQLIREGCSLLVGAWDSGATISAAQVAESKQVPLLVNIASAPQITEQGFKQLFRNFTPGTTLVANAVARIKELSALTGVQPKTAVLMHVNDTFGQGIVRGVDVLWEKLGMPIKILGRISYDARTRDLAAEVAKARSFGADLLMPVTRVNDAILLVRELVKQDWSPTGIISPGSPGPYEKAFTDAVGKYGDGYMVCVPWYDPSKPRARELVARYEKETGDRFELNSGFAFEAIEIAADAIKRAASPEPAAIHAALKTTNIDDHVMYGGPIQFDEKGQNPNIGGVMLQNQNSKPLVVGPQKIAQAKAIFPIVPFAER